MPSEVAAVMDIGLTMTSMEAEATATSMRIEEGVRDYTQAIGDLQARGGEMQAEASRRIGTTRQEGVLTLKEQGAQGAYEGRMAMTQAEMVASSEEAKLGASGVRATGSPLAAAQQNVDLASAAADRTIERGNAGMAVGGLRLGNSMADIQAQSTLLTADYTRQGTELARKRKELLDNRDMMVTLARWGGAGALGTSFYNLSKAFGG